MKEAWYSGGRWRRVLGLAVALGVTGACSDGPAGPGEEVQEDAELVMAANLAGANIATLVVKVTAPDISGVLVFNLTIDEGGFAFGTIKVPPGNDRLITVQAFDDLGIITHEGAALVNVQPGNNPPVFIALVPRSGHVPLEIMMGDVYVFVYGPGSGVAGGQLQLFAEVWGPLGPVSGEVEWATDNPAVATVDQDGLVSLLIPGTVRVYGVSSGYSGYVQITVLEPGTGLIQGSVWNAFTGEQLIYVDITLDGSPVSGVDQYGQFSIPVATGPHTVGVILWGHPECTPPADQDVTVFEGAITFVGFGVECTGGIANNETDLPEEADYCSLWFPATISAGDGEPFQIYGRAFEAGVTEFAGDPNDAGFPVLAQFGFGPVGSDPRFDLGWNFLSAQYNTQVANDDEWLVDLSGSAGTEAAYVFRISMNGGGSWTYCDLDGAGSNADLDFSPAQLGYLLIN